MAKIRDQDIDDLRERADIVDIVSGYTQLKRAGGQSLKGLCPFHSEKTPSFTVDGGRGLWFCFGCKLGGNVYQFVEKVENLPFAEAVEWVARRAGYDLHYEEMRPGEQAAHGLKARLAGASAAAAEFCHHRLMEGPDAAAAREYLAGRGFGPETAQRWQLGWAPGRNEICRHLLAGGFSEREIEQADLGRRSERDGGLYDTFRARILFPTWNLQGDVVGFGARALGDVQPKYLNTSETPIFSKSRLMYGLHRAKSSIVRSAAVVVEGYTDVIALHEAGITEAVATNGVALGQTHFELLKKFTERAVLMFDADEAGQAATERGFELGHRIGLEVLVAPLDSGRDPAEVVVDDGPDVIRKIVGEAQPLLEFKLEQTIAKLTIDTPEARARAVREAAQILSWHPDPIARHEYAFLAARLIGVAPEMVQGALRDLQSVGAETGGDVASARRMPGTVKVELEALRLLLTGTADDVSDLTEEHFTSAARREVFRAAITGAAASAGSAAERLSNGARALFAELMLSPPSPEAQGGERTREVFDRLRVFLLDREIKILRERLQDINPTVDAKGHDELFTALVGMEASRRDLLRRLQGEG